jgi:hypothetical protein
MLMVLLFGFTLNILDFAVFLNVKDDVYQKVDKSMELSLWIIIETCSTLGYGEVTPKSYLGKFATILSALFGWFFISLLIIVAGEKLELKGEEFDAYILYKKKAIREKTENKARIVILNILLFRMILMNQHKRMTFPFLLANKNYDIFYFAKIGFEKSNEIYNKLKKRNFKLNSDIRKIINEINPIFLNFYNKIISKNKISAEALEFYRLNRFLNSFLPNSNEEMHKVTKSIEKNYSKLDDYISSKLSYIKDEFNDLFDSTIDFNEKMKGIIDMQNKLASTVLEVNNKSFSNKIKKLPHLANN